jgi:RNA polymerase sigma-70 factor (ECF subfamily)
VYGAELTVPDDNVELETLLVRCAARDASALAALYERVAPQLLGVLTRMLRTRASAEDALQDVFIRVWQQSAQFDQLKGRAMGWLVSIARNRAIDLQRGTRISVMLDAAELSGAEQLQVMGDAERTEFSAAQSALARCLNLLGVQQRQCVLLSYQHGLTQEKIAMSLGQPLGSVKSWVRRGLMSLRECMES